MEERRKERKTEERSMGRDDKGGLESRKLMETKGTKMGQKGKEGKLRNRCQEVKDHK